MMSSSDDVVVAILAKDKAVTLPLYLSCLEIQTFPKERIHLYVRANDSSDNTVEVLRRWIDANGRFYKSVTVDYSDIGGLRHYGHHEWDVHRFRVLGQIRQASVDHARRLGCHYFVADADTFVVPTTIENMFESGLPVVAPMVRTPYTEYSNFFPRADSDGYAIVGLPEYTQILTGRVRGFILVDVVHTAYFVRSDVLDQLCFDDGSGRVEYVIGSEVLRSRGIGQYLDNRQIYGVVGFLGGEAAQAWGGFDHVNFTWRVVNLSNEPMRIPNDETAY